MEQNTLKPSQGSKHRRKRVGRGNASGHGTFSGRGVKGQKARTGGRRRPGFEGGQTPLLRRMPKLKGFKNPNKEHFCVLNVKDLNIFENGSTVDVNTLFEQKIISDKKHPIKILGDGNIEKNLNVTADTFSLSAEEKITKAGGKIVKLRVKLRKEHEKKEPDANQQPES